MAYTTFWAGRDDKVQGRMVMAWYLVRVLDKIKQGVYRLDRGLY